MKYDLVNKTIKSAIKERTQYLTKNLLNLKNVAKACMV